VNLYGYKATLSVGAAKRTANLRRIQLEKGVQ